MHSRLRQRKKKNAVLDGMGFKVEQNQIDEKSGFGWNDEFGCFQRAVAQPTIFAEECCKKLKNKALIKEKQDHLLFVFMLLSLSFS